MPATPGHRGDDHDATLDAPPRTGLRGLVGQRIGYRPFVSTDASVADTGDVEIEFGYIGFRADHAGPRSWRGRS
jgi:hypothetical protein